MKIIKEILYKEKIQDDYQQISKNYSIKLDNDLIITINKTKTESNNGLNYEWFFINHLEHQLFKKLSMKKQQAVIDFINNIKL
jgi:hypothetical protein